VTSFIPVNEPLLNGNEKRYLEQCIDTGWISSEGPFVKRLEEEFAARVGRKHAVAVANGSVALDLAVAALGIGPGDEVILPSFTIISCASAIVRAGATPVAVDCDPKHWNMNVAQVAQRITPRTKAVMAVHIYGLCVDMEALVALCKPKGIAIIEDAAEAHGQAVRGKPCGSFGDISTFSFYPNKHITTGEGGMVMVDDDALAKRCQSLRNLCFQPEKRFVHEELGWNFRMSNLQAAVGCAQLERLDEFTRIKQAMGKRYDSLLAGLDAIERPLPAVAWADNIYWVYGVVLKDHVPFDATAAMQKLGKLGVGTRPFFWPMHEQPVFKKMGLFLGESLPVSERLARRGFYLPSGMALTQAQAERVVEALHEVLA
jgi:perosamine synthetase